ncbi:hypothetical protein [Rhizobacter sp. SG703]|uniref:hypothetical protein n=1 Tax=Rhizobacter sp. SG703 TaxID=2587140 RepID=UPI0014468BAB|nr:hypothetical protein [Rhizobacter sp. SG703]NKI97842.1 hypothetical protein [Rhizobacter sp. SG703]
MATQIIESMFIPARVRGERQASLPESSQSRSTGCGRLLPVGCFASSAVCGPIPGLATADLAAGKRSFNLQHEWPLADGKAGWKGRSMEGLGTAPKMIEIFWFSIEFNDAVEIVEGRWRLASHHALMHVQKMLQAFRSI